MNIPDRTSYQVWVRVDDETAHPFRLALSLLGAAHIIENDRSGLNLFIVRETATYEVVA